MKKRLLSMLLVVCMVFSLLPAIALTANAAAGDLPTTMSVEPSDTNGIPARIDIFKRSSSSGGGWPGGGGGTTTTTYELYLPGNVDPAKCFFSWADGLQASVDGQTYASGACPVPAPDESKTYTFTKGSSTQTFTVKTFQGSSTVKPIFIDIDESKGTIAAMDGDPDHETSCSGMIYIDGEEFTLSKIKGRGNYTWSQARDKKAYNLTLDRKCSILGIDSPQTKKWSILGEIADHSLLCNRSGFALAHQLDVGNDTASADVWMNGEYQGCYTVTPKYDSFVTKDGFLIEDDNYKESLSVEDGGDPQFALEGLNAPGNNSQWGGGGSDYNLITVKAMGDNLLMVNGVVDDSPAGMTNAANKIKAWLQDAWDAIRSDDGKNAKGKYYTDYIDIESFAKMYLMHEYVKSYDVCAGSILFHRDGQTDDDKLIAGPIWDLDNAMGSTQSNGSLGSVGDRRSGKGAFITEINEYKTSIYKTIGRHEDFMEEVYRQYNLNKAAFDNLPNVVQSMMDDIEKSAMMNHAKVENVGYNNHNYSRATTFEQGTEYEQNMKATTDNKTDWPNYASNLKEYIKARSTWFANTYTREDEGFVANINAGVGATVTTYAKQADAVNDQNGVEGEKYVYATDPTTGEVTKDGNGQINFRVKMTAPYVLDSVTAEPADNFEKVEMVSDGLYRVTKVTGPIAIKISTVENICTHEFGEDGICTKCGMEAYKITFDCDEHCTVTSFDSSDVTGEGRPNAEFAFARNKDTGEIDVSGSGQLYFVVNVDEGYAVNVEHLVGEPKNYNKLKDPADASVPNSFGITKIEGPFVLHVTTMKVGNPNSDYFADGGYDESAWEILNPDAENYSVETGKGIVMPTQRYDIYSTGAAWKNCFVTPTDGDWKAVTKAVYPKVPTQNYQQAMMLVWGDEDNYIRINCQQSNLSIQPGKETNGSFSSSGFQQPRAQAAEDGSVTLYWMIEKTGTTYTLSYSQDGLNYTELGSTTAEYEEPKIGLFATANTDNGANDAIDVYFEYLAVLGHNGVEEVTPAEMLNWAAQNVADYTFAALPATEVDADLVLPAAPHGYTVNVVCDHPEIIDAEGKFTEPETDTQVSVSLTVTEGDAIGTTSKVKLLAKGKAAAVVPVATFVTDTHCSVTAYDTSDLSGEGHPNATTALSRDKSTGNPIEGGQVWFVVNVDEGYEIESVTAEPAESFNKLKDPADETVPNSYNLTKVVADLTITVTTKKTGGGEPGPGLANIDFTDPADADKFEIVAQTQSEQVEGEGVALICTRNAIETCNGQNSGDNANTPEDLVEIPVAGDWTATLTVDFDTNTARNGYYAFFGFYAAQGDDYQNMAGIRGGDGAMQDFLRVDGAITADTDGVKSSPGFASNGTYYLRIEKEGTTYTCYRGTAAETRALDNVTFTKMFSYEDTGIEATKIVIDAYTGMTEGYKFTLKSLDFEGGEAPPAVDKTALADAIAAAEAVDKTAYTEASVAAMEAALDAAKAVNAAADADQAAVDAAASALNEAVAALEPAAQDTFEVTFVCGEGATIDVLKTQALDGEIYENVTTAVPRDKTNFEPDYSGEGQVNFVVRLAEGYVLDGDVSAEGGYKNLKGPEDTGIENGYRITKIAGDVTVTVNTKKNDPGDCEHEYTTTNIPATCTEPAKIRYTCSKCGYWYEETGYSAPEIETEISVPSTYTSTRTDYTYGRRESITYYSTTAGRNKNANVQLPVNYDPSKKYPVMYLLHGVMGSENDMVGNGTIIQNLVADGLAEEMIIVCPNMWSSNTSSSPAGINQTTMEGYDRFHLDLVNDLMPYMAEHYSVAEGKENTAVCGFSQGGRETLLIGLYHPDKIGYLCAISSAPGIVAATDQYMSHPGVFKEEEVRYDGETPYLIMMTSGDNDNVVGKNPQEYHRIYEQNGIVHTWWEIPGADHGGATNSGVYNFAKYAFKVQGEGAPLGHDWDEGKVTEPTCTQEGYTEYTCKRCGEVEKRDQKNKLPHNYVDGVCTMCGEKLITVTVEADDGATVTIYETQDPAGATVTGTTTNPRASDTGLIDCSGDGQVNFSFKLKSGYVLDSVTAEPAEAYKNLKGPDDTGIKNGYRVTKITGDLTISIKTTYTGEVSSLADIDFTDPADADKYEIAGQSESAVEEGVGLALVASQGGIEPAKQNIAEQDIDVVRVPVSGDWTATLEVEFDANGAANGYYQFFGFVASEGGDNQNMVGIRGGDGAMQDFIRKDGAITEETQSSAPGFDTTGKTYYLRIEKEGDSYTCYRSDDGEAFTEMFAYEGTGIEADEILIDAYTGMTAGYKFTLKSLTFEGGEPKPVDKSKLDEAVTAAEAVNKDDYTEESVTALEEAVAAAKAVQADPDATQKQVNDAAKAVNDAVSALVPKEQPPVVDKTKLDKAIEDAGKVDTDKYTEESVKALEEAVAAAKAVQADDKATQQQVDDAEKAVKDAVDALELKPDEFLFDDVKDPGKFYFDPVYWAYYADPQITNGIDDTHFGPDNACTRGHVVTFLWRAAGCPAPKSAETPFTDLKKGAFYEKAVAWAVENEITNGMSADKFAPDATCTRGQIVTFLWRFKGQPDPKSTDTPFTDLKKGAFYEKAVSWAVENEVTNGMTATTFGPDATCTRGQVVTFLYRATKD